MDVIMMVEGADTSKALNNNKVAGPDQIPAELLRCRGTSTITVLTRLLNACWQEEYVPEEQRVIVKLSKKATLQTVTTGAVSHLYLFSAISFCAILPRWLHKAIDASLHKEQARCCSGHSCTGQISTLYSIIEQCIKFQHTLSVSVINFKKVFDSVHRESLRNITRMYGILQ